MERRGKGETWAIIEKSRPTPWKDHCLIQPRDTAFHPGLAITDILRRGDASLGKKAAVLAWPGANFWRFSKPIRFFPLSFCGEKVRE